MRSILFYTPVIGFASGVFLRSLFQMGWAEIVFLFLIGGALFLMWYLRKSEAISVLSLLGIFFIACALGVVRLDVKDDASSQLASFVGATHTFEGVVVREPEARATTRHLYIREATTQALFLAYADPYLDVAYGDRVRITGELTVPDIFETETGRQFDYVGYLKARGVEEVMYRPIVIVEATGQGNSFIASLLMTKHYFMQVLERSMSEPALGLGEGILLGVKRALGEELEEIFRIVGIIHIVVLSGYNIMIVAESVMRFFSLFFFPRTRLLLGLITILCFALLVGLSATVVRASIMVSLVLIARTIGRSYAVLRALSLAGVVMLLVNPYLLVFDPGFQLSFLATLGLVLLAPSLEERFTKVPELFGLRGYLATTLGTQLFVLPLLLYSIGTLSLVSVLANVLVLPVVPLAMLLTFLTGVVGSVSPFLAMFVAFVAQGALAYIIVVAEFLSTIPFAAVTIPAFPWWGMLVLFAFVFCLTLWLKERCEPEAREFSRDYDDWTIEVETDTPPGTRSVPGGVSEDFPFK